MDAEKYNVSITMICPTCGGTQFEFEDQSEDSTPVKCPTCKREFTKGELIEFNSENISAHVEEIGTEVAKDLGDELRRSFAGNKFIKIS